MPDCLVADASAPSLPVHAVSPESLESFLADSAMAPGEGSGPGMRVGGSFDTKGGGK